MICPNCQKMIPNDVEICPECGAPVNAEMKPETVGPSADTMDSSEGSAAAGEVPETTAPAPAAPQADTAELLKMQTKLYKLACAILVLLIIIAAGVAMLNIRGAGSAQSYRALTVVIDSDLSDSKTSDLTQIENGLTNGGRILIDPDNMDPSFEESIVEYAAEDASGSYYTYGGIVNYVASRGWKLVQTPSTGFSTDYDFIKEE